MRWLSPIQPPIVTFGVHSSQWPASRRYFLSNSVEAKVSAAYEEHTFLSKKLELSFEEGNESLSGEEYQKISIQISNLAPLAEAFEKYQSLQKELESLKELVEEISKDGGSDEEDREMRNLAAEEKKSIMKTLEQVEEKIFQELVPKNEIDRRGAIMEVRAGAGGDEASLFAAELVRMYQRYAVQKGWSTEMLSASTSSSVSGGLKEAVMAVSTPSYGGDITPVFGKLKAESGVHRVQRVPKTESQGRLHTSAVAIVVLPEANSTDVELNASDLRIETMRAQGAGGQSVNTTDSAVRITHIPTGISVSMQDERSQHRNKAKAMTVLSSRIFDHFNQRELDERNTARQAAVASADRSQRIRTYNFPQNRLTDHRLSSGMQCDLTSFLEGDMDSMDHILDALEQLEHARQLEDILNSD